MPSGSKRRTIRKQNFEAEGLFLVFGNSIKQAKPNNKDKPGGAGLKSGTSWFVLSRSDLFDLSDRFGRLGIGSLRNLHLIDHIKALLLLFPEEEGGDEHDDTHNGNGSAGGGIEVVGGNETGHDRDDSEDN